MYDQIRNDTLFGMLYAVVSALFLAACCYLLFRQGNAFARDVTPPVRLRRWTAAYFAATAVCHLWYMQIFFLTSAEDIMMTDLIGGLLDSVLAVPLVICVMLNMLQDRRRPLWPIPLMIAPFVVGEVYSIATLSYAVIPMLHVYLLLLSICIAIYMFRATRQYGRWLRDNYADLEHKEVWQSLVVLALMLLLFVFYTFLGNVTLFLYAYQLFGIVFLGYLLWRVETLSDLSVPVNDVEEEADVTVDVEDKDLPLSIRNHIGVLLQQHCIDKQLYLQHDLNIIQLAKAIGTNRFYLSQYFSCQGTTYNEYINHLRIDFFISLYHKAVATHRHYTAHQLAIESGFRSYNTFMRVFKQRMGQNVRKWMDETGQNCSNQQ
jgi:AraC-like DNA-binding protein